MAKGVYTYINKKWTPEIDQFLLKHKNLKKEELYTLLKREFPELDVTYCAMKNQCSRIGAVMFKSYHGATKQKSLYSERVKKGYVQIKIGFNPSTWWSKAKWVYVESHPWEWNEIEPTDNFYFLDGNNRNFDPNNIVKVKMRERGVFATEGGIVPGQPQISMQNLLRARLKLAMLDRGEKLGLVKALNSQVGRYFKEEHRRKHNAWYKKFYSDPENRERRNAYARKKWHEKKNDPEFKAKVKQWKKNTKLRAKGLIP